MSGMNMGLSSEMERRAEDGTDFSHFGDESNKGNELGLDSEPQGTGGPKPRKHFRGFQRKPEANLLLLKAVLKHQPFKHGNVGPGNAKSDSRWRGHTWRLEGTSCLRSGYPHASTNSPSPRTPKIPCARTNPRKNGRARPRARRRAGWAAVTAEINSHTDLFAGEETGCTVDTCRNTYERLVESWFKHDRRVPRPHVPSLVSPVTSPAATSPPPCPPSRPPPPLRRAGGVRRADERAAGVAFVVQHAFLDALPFETCCKLSPVTGDCDRFYPQRAPAPSGVARSVGFGEPHFNTWDGVGYTFNGVGDYW